MLVSIGECSLSTLLGAIFIKDVITILTGGCALSAPDILFQKHNAQSAGVTRVLRHGSPFEVHPAT